MVILGLTGSIAMGKSTAAAMFRRLGAPVFDADRTVHRLLGRGGEAVRSVEHAFPGAACDGAVDHRVVAKHVFADPAALRRLEAILHPLVLHYQSLFLRSAARRRADIVVLDVPLLFEVGIDRSCDAIVVVSAPHRVQYGRLRRRPGMSRERIEAVLSRQMPDAEKRRRADFIVPTGLGRALSFNRIKTILAVARSWPARCWPPQSRPHRRRRRINLAVPGRRYA